MILLKKPCFAELSAILPEVQKEKNYLSDYEVLKDKLGSAGASGRIAREMVREMHK